MSLPTIFKSEVLSILAGLASAGRDRHPDYRAALEDIAIALSEDPPATQQFITAGKSHPLGAFYQVQAERRR